jgi:glucose-6-phosphate-specific signal transduction histidine kinase
MDVAADIAADLRSPGPLSRTAYRICAEALSNAAKHGRPGPVALQVARDGDDVVVHTRNPAGTHPAPRRNGYGLAGLRETVSVFGGRLTAGQDGADWVFEVRLPAGGGRG